MLSLNSSPPAPDGASTPIDLSPVLTQQSNKRPRNDSLITIDEESASPKCLGCRINSLHENFPFSLIQNKIRTWRIDVENSAIHTKQCFDSYFNLK